MTDAQLGTWIADFLLDCQATGLSPRTIAWYQSNLRQFQGFAQQQGWSTVTTPELRAYVCHLSGYNVPGA
ncbi:MAG: site-specific integrase, partial [Chloroflexi bacterium]|nr:site-specific integrase [Chloroflexota bacterium]